LIRASVGRLAAKCIDLWTTPELYGDCLQAERNSAIVRVICRIVDLAVFHLKGKCSLYSITERRVPELIPVLGSEPASDVSHKPCGRLPLLSARPGLQLPPQPIRGLLPVSLLGEQRHDGCEQFA